MPYVRERTPEGDRLDRKKKLFLHLKDWESMGKPLEEK